LTKSIIEINDISFSYSDKLPVLTDISFSVGEGEFLSVLGYNGSGKSTLAKLLNGILLPTEGKVLVDGIDTSDEQRIFEVRRRVGMVFQNPDNQIVASTVEEDVAFGLENIGVEPSEMRERVDDALRIVGMYERRHQSPNRLSGGQKQRVAIAGILAMRPKCIILDEPTAMLDPKGREKVLATIKMLNREFGITIVLITHFMEEAAEADRVIVLSEGKIVKNAAPREVFSDAVTMRKFGLDVPAAAILAEELRAIGVAVPRDAIYPEDIYSFFGLAGGEEQ